MERGTLETDKEERNEKEKPTQGNGVTSST